MIGGPRIAYIKVNISRLELAVFNFAFWSLCISGIAEATPNQKVKSITSTFELYPSPCKICYRLVSSIYASTYLHFLTITIFSLAGNNIDQA